jgi:mono/diheme cytochrome c family protein
MPGPAVWTTLLGVVLALCCPARAALAEDSSAPRIHYILHCQGCHLPDGAGTPGKVPALKDQVGLFLQVPGGREYLIQVPGTSQSALNDAEVAAVLNWMLHNFSAAQLPDDFAPYTSEEVARFRPHPLADVNAVRVELLARIQAGQAAAAQRNDR